MERFKKNPLRDVILIIVVAAISIFIFKKCFSDERVAADLPTYQQVQVVKQQESKTGVGYAEKEYLPAPTLAASGIPKAKYDSLLNVIGVKEKNVEALTLVAGKFQDSLKLARVERDAANNKVWHWEKTYKSGSKTISKMSEKDSVLHQESDLRVAAIDRKEGNKYYTDFYPLDDNVKFNGAYVFRKEQKEIKDILQLDVVGGFNKSFVFPKAYGTLETQLIFNPDGKLSPAATVGGISTIDNNFKLDWFYGVKLKYNVFRLRK